MNKTAQIELHRTFLIERLPEPLTTASSHLQLYDNYIENTRLRLRQIRDPYAKTWIRILQQRMPATESGMAMTKFAEIHLNDDEYRLFERFEAREIRKNRYFHEFDRISMIFDVYLGRLWGLSMARVDFETIDAMTAYEPPPFIIFEVTNDAFFAGENLVERSFADIQAEVERLGYSTPSPAETADE